MSALFGWQSDPLLFLQPLPLIFPFLLISRAAEFLLIPFGTTRGKLLFYSVPTWPDPLTLN